MLRDFIDDNTEFIVGGLVAAILLLLIVMTVIRSGESSKQENAEAKGVARGGHPGAATSRLPERLRPKPPPEPDEPGRAQTPRAEQKRAARDQQRRKRVEYAKRRKEEKRRLKAGGAKAARCPSPIDNPRVASAHRHHRDCSRRSRAIRN